MTIASFGYSGALAVSLFCLALADWRYKLAWFYDPRRTAKVFAVLLALLILWDLVGIALGIFFPGKSAFTLGFELVYAFPVEELGFLSLLVYTTLLVTRFLEERS